MAAGASPDFPAGDYTPHGYLRNRYDAGPWWGLSAGGPIRSVESCGFEWRANEAERGGLRVGVRIGETTLLGPADFEAAGVRLVSRYHTSSAQSFDFEHAGVRAELTFCLATRDALACRARLGGSGEVELLGMAHAAKPRHRNAGGIALAGTVGVAPEAGPWYALVASRPLARQGYAASLDEVPAALAAGSPPRHYAFDSYLDAPVVFAAASLSVELAGEAEVWLAVGRGATPEAAINAARDGLVSAPTALADLLAEDQAFWGKAPRLTGDWPEHWRRGWVYDFETTRLLVFPPAGVFSGPWPSWMADSPRVVLAENSLDMLRLGFAAPTLAWDAIETVFTSAEARGAPNVPCLFANGVANMVASDGSACGTSPAWCLPFRNLWQLYLFAPDRPRLARLYPRLDAFLEWWLEHRTDPEGWVVYKCTWEAGEDCTPRLDPQATGHSDISETVRPVELQAAVADSARILAWFARELQIGDSAERRWLGVYEEYRDRTRRMWDAERRQFRDVLRATGEFSQSDATYWGSNVHHDALQLIPLLGEIATTEQRAALAGRLDEFDAPPWVLWPSWSYVVAEAALAAGRPEMATRLSARVVDRVYRENDRRSLREHPRPLPGVAREYWPLSLDNWKAAEAYGWGANTLLHVLRYLIGFAPSETTGAFEFTLSPGVPAELGAGRFGLSNLHYRGRRVDLALERRPDGSLEVEIQTEPPSDLRVSDGRGRAAEIQPSELGLRIVGRAATYRIREGSA